MRRVLVIALLASACDSAGGLDYSGTPGQEVPVTIANSVPVIDASADGAPGRFLVDSGSPASILDLTGGQPGTRRVVLDAFALSFADVPVAVFDLFAGAEEAVNGLVGGDVISGFDLTIDYRNQRGWLADDDALPAGVDPATIDDPVWTGAQLRGGGRLDVPGCTTGDCSVHVGATRLLVEVSLESAPPAWFLVDTGATAVVLAPDVADALGDPARPRLDGVTVTTADGPATAYYTRVAEMSLADGAAVATDVPVLVLPASLLAPLEDEVGHPIAGLLGGSFLRQFLITLDDPGHRLRLARFRDQDHIDADEFVGVGFTMASQGGVWEVRDVYSGTDAAAEGLVRGEPVVSLDGVTIGGADRATVNGILAGFALGDDVPVGVVRAGTDVTVQVAVEDLLPHYINP